MTPSICSGRITFIRLLVLSKSSMSNTSRHHGISSIQHQSEIVRLYRPSLTWRTERYHVSGPALPTVALPQSPGQGPSTRHPIHQVGRACESIGSQFCRGAVTIERSVQCTPHTIKHNENDTKKTTLWKIQIPCTYIYIYIWGPSKQTRRESHPSNRVERAIQPQAKWPLFDTNLKKK